MTGTQFELEFYIVMIVLMIAQLIWGIGHLIINIRSMKEFNKIMEEEI